MADTTYLNWPFFAPHTGPGDRARRLGAAHLRVFWTSMTSTLVPPIVELWAGRLLEYAAPTWIATPRRPSTCAPFA